MASNDFDFEKYLDDVFEGKDPDEAANQEPDETQTSQAASQEEDGEQAAQEESRTQEDETQEAAAEGQDGDQDGIKPGEVPYKRFAEVARDRRSLRDKVKELEAQLAEAKKTPQTSTPEKAEDETDIDALVNSILGDEELEAGTADKATLQRLEKVEEELSRQQFEKELTTTLGKYPDVDRDWLIKETIRTQGRFSPEELARGKSEDNEITTNEAVSKFLDEHPELKKAYLAKQQGTDDGTTKPPAEKADVLPTLKNTPSKKKKPNLDPKDGESNDDYLSRVWDAFMD